MQKTLVASRITVMQFRRDKQTTATDSLRLQQIEGLQLQHCTVTQGSDKIVPQKEGAWADARSTADLVVALVQVSILAHHKQGGHHAGKDGNITAYISRVSVLLTSSARSTDCCDKCMLAS